MDVRSKINGISLADLPARALSWGLARLKSEFSEMWARAGGFKISPSRLPSIVPGDLLTPSDAAAAILGSITQFSPSDNAFNIVRERFPEYVGALLADCDKTSAGHFHILGKDVDYSSAIRWHYDPLWDHEFPASTFHARIPHANPDGGYDIKYPWELSRLQHLPRLALGYRLSGNKTFRMALISQLENWIDRNPVGFGPNWACTMDVAIRAANFCFALAVLNDHHLDSAFLEKSACSLIEHGRFIASNLEWSDTLTSNHYLANIAGLGVLASHLHNLVPEAKSWLEFSHAELESELLKQVYPDGWDFEASTAYHRLVLEMFLIPAIFISRAGLSFTDIYRARLRDMTRCLADISMPDGSIPLIGDNDSGLFMALGTDHVENVNYLLSLSSAFPGERFTSEIDPEIFWLLGPDASPDFEKGKSDNPYQAGKVIEYHDGGLYILNSRDHTDMVTFRLGQVGQKGNGGHAHNDQLSVTIWFDSRPIVIDPGTAVYTSDPSRRNHYRSTRSHATIAIGDMEQNPFVENKLFTLPQAIRTEFVGADSDDEKISVTGAIRGYGSIRPDEIRIVREVSYNKQRRQVEIRDEITSETDLPDTTAWIFPLGDGLVPASKGTNHVKLLDGDETPVAEIMYLPGWQLKVIDSVYSPVYGVEKPNVTIVFLPPSDTYSAEFIFRAIST